MAERQEDTPFIIGIVLIAERQEDTPFYYKYGVNGWKVRRHPPLL